MMRKKQQIIADARYADKYKAKMHGYLLETQVKAMSSICQDARALVKQRVRVHMSDNAKSYHNRGWEFALS